MQLKLQIRHPAPRSALIADKHQWLTGWAMHFAQGDRSLAEDMVQDTFVKFLLLAPEAIEDEGVEPLLFTYLKYTHLAHLRRIQRYPHRNLSIEEFDSIDLGLRANPTGELIQVQNQLRVVVSFLCSRKEASKTASVLILRFLHGYLPEEIMHIGLLSRAMVDRCLKMARAEVKAHIRETGTVRIVREEDLSRPEAKAFAVAEDDFLREIRAMVFRSCASPCLSEETLLGLYRTKAATPVEGGLLAHIVSCERCLRLVSRVGTTPGSGVRNRNDMLQIVQRMGEGAGRGGEKGVTDFERDLAVAERRVAVLQEHQPRQLITVVDGHVAAIQEVGASGCRQEVWINNGQSLTMVEVYSEQGICLAAMVIPVEMARRAPELHQQCQLSCGRLIETSVRFTSLGINIETAYSDPSVESTLQGFAGEFDVRGTDCSAVSSPGTSETVRETRWPWPIWWQIREPFSSILNGLRLPGASAGFVVASFAGALAICSFVVMGHKQSMAAGQELLERAVRSEPVPSPGAESGVLLQRIRIQSTQGTIERTLYRDTQGRRVARQGALDASAARLRAELAEAGVNWDNPLSASGFKQWHDAQKDEADSIREAGTNLAALSTTVKNDEVQSEELVLRESDYHPVSRTIRLRHAGSVEIAELEYERIPWSAVEAGAFEPETGPRSRAEPIPAARPMLPAMPTEGELSEAELGARLALNSLQADRSGRLTISRSAGGIEVTGIVEDQARKTEITSRLRSVPLVTASLSTFADLEQLPAIPGQPTSIHTGVVNAENAPVTIYLDGRGVDAKEIRAILHGISGAEAAIEQEAAAISDLRSKFGPTGHSPPHAVTVYNQLLASRVQRLATALDREQASLQQVGQVAANPAAANPGSDLVMLSNQNSRFCDELLSSDSENKRDVSSTIADLLGVIRSLRAALTRVEPAEPTGFPPS